MAMAGKVAEQLRKITVATCGAQPDMELLAKLEKKGQGARADLLDVFGIVMKWKPGSSDKGEYIRFVGMFKAKNLITGDEYTAPAAIFPKMIEESLWAVLKPAEEGANDVQMAFRIGVKFDKDAATKYTYVATALLKPSESDPLALLEKQVGESLKALAAPKS
jgi:hypothetical protein